MESKLQWLQTLDIIRKKSLLGVLLVCYKGRLDSVCFPLQKVLHCEVRSNINQHELSFPWHFCFGRGLALWQAGFSALSSSLPPEFVPDSCLLAGENMTKQCKKRSAWALNFIAEWLETAFWVAKALIVNLCKIGPYLVPVFLHQGVHKTVSSDNPLWPLLSSHPKISRPVDDCSHVRS